MASSESYSRPMLIVVIEESMVEAGRKGLKAYEVHKKDNDSGDIIYKEQNMLNFMAMASYLIQEYDSAFHYIQQAIERDPNISYPYTTLAEIHLMVGNKAKFYENLEKALKKGFSIENLLGTYPYKKFENEPRFIALKKNIWIHQQLLRTLIHRMLNSLTRKPSCYFYTFV